MMRARGFTLLEILIALAILGIALSAATRAMGVSTDTAIALRQRTVAGWVAQNHMAELVAAHEYPAIGSRSGTATQGTRSFAWNENVRATDNPYFRRVEIQVFAGDDPDRVAYRLVGYLAQSTP